MAIHHHIVILILYTLFQIPAVFPVDPSNPVVHDFSPIFRVYKNGRVERLMGTKILPAGYDSKTNVISKDITFSDGNNISARIYLPKHTDKVKKLPLLIYIHGGAFVIETPFSPTYHRHLNSLTSEAKVIAVSIHYRRAPEYPLPIAYEDTWAAVKWVASHANSKGVEPWLNDHADFHRFFLAGDSAGGTLAHYAAMQVGIQKLKGVKLVGLVASHPYFKDEKPDKLIEYIFPTSKGSKDPRLNPAADPNLKNLGTKNVLIFTGEKDFLRNRAWSYYGTLKKSGWDGKVKIKEYEGEGHVFYLLNPNSPEAVNLRKIFVKFLKKGSCSFEIRDT